MISDYWRKLNEQQGDILEEKDPFTGETFEDFSKRRGIKTEIVDRWKDWKPF